MPDQLCDVFFRVVCVTPTDVFPIWEIVVSVVLTGTVTWLTIWASIRGARRETERTIEASVQAEDRARNARKQEAKRAADQEQLRQRIVLAEALSHGVYRMNQVRELPEDDRARVEAEAEWGALRVSFYVSSAPHATDIYDFASLRINEAMNAPPHKGDVDSIVEFAIRTQFAQGVSEAASYWAKHAALDEKTKKKFDLLRVEDEIDGRKTTQELIGRLDVLSQRSRGAGLPRFRPNRTEGKA